MLHSRQPDLVNLLLELSCRHGVCRPVAGAVCRSALSGANRCAAAVGALVPRVSVGNEEKLSASVDSVGATGRLSTESVRSRSVSAASAGQWTFVECLAAGVSPRFSGSSLNPPFGPLKTDAKDGRDNGRSPFAVPFGSFRYTLSIRTIHLHRISYSHRDIESCISASKRTSLRSPPTNPATMKSETIPPMLFLSLVPNNNSSRHSTSKIRLSHSRRPTYFYDRKRPLDLRRHRQR